MIRFIAFADCCNSNTITLNDNLFYFSNISCEHLWGSWVINFQYRYLSVYSWCRCLAISLSYYITQGVLLLQTNYCSASICSGATACKWTLSQSRIVWYWYMMIFWIVSPPRLRKVTLPLQSWCYICKQKYDSYYSLAIKEKYPRLHSTEKQFWVGVTMVTRKSVTL